MAEQSNQEQAKLLRVSSSPHLAEGATSRRIMYEVVIGMLPAAAMAIYLFRTAAVAILATCVIAGLITEWLFNRLRKKPHTITDGSVIVTGMILGLSLPPSIPLWAATVGMVVSVAVVKMLFGGLGSNIFNPAMVGRAFLMASFGTMMTTWTLPVPLQEAGVTQATPLQVAKRVIKTAAKMKEARQQQAQDALTNTPDNLQENRSAPEPSPLVELNGRWQSMFMGNISGSTGETSALLWLVGGLFLLWRRTITWHIPLTLLGSALAVATLAWLIDREVYAGPLVHLSGGGLMMCAFFIATDPVSCPLSRLGRIIFGIGVGVLIMMIRLIGGYPEGVMYAILLMNSMTPLLDRWTRPRVLGTGKVKA